MKEYDKRIDIIEKYENEFVVLGGVMWWSYLLINNSLPIRPALL